MRIAPSRPRRPMTAMTVTVMVLVTHAPAQQTQDLLIRNGLVVTADGRTQSDLRIRNGTIVETGSNLPAQRDAQVIDARGMLVLPGGVDPHVHLTPVRTADTAQGADDYTTASRAALAGGKTTISNFINLPDSSELRSTLIQAKELVAKQSIADVILHLTAGHPDRLTAADVAMLADQKVTLKIFMVRPIFDQNAAAYYDLIRAAGAAGILTMLHAEDAGIISTTQNRLMAEGRGSLRGQNFAESRPVVAEDTLAEGQGQRRPWAPGSQPRPTTSSGVTVSRKRRAATVILRNAGANCFSVVR